MTFDQMDVQLHALLQSNRNDVQEKMRFDRIPEGYPHAGDWGVRMDTVGDENWPWLRDISCMPSRCADHLHAILRKHHYAHLCKVDDDDDDDDDDDPEEATDDKRIGQHTYWYWKHNFSPEVCLATITPVRLNRKRKRPLEEDLEREKSRNKQLQRCTARALQDLQDARAKHAKDRKVRDVAMHEMSSSLRRLHAQHANQTLELHKALALIRQLQEAMQVVEAAQKFED